MRKTGISFGLIPCLLVLGPWVLCTLALLSGSNLLEGLFFSAHGGLFLVIVPFANLAATAFVVASVVALRGSERALALVIILCGFISLALLAHPLSHYLASRLNPPFSDTAEDYYVMLFSPVHWLLPR